MVDLNEDTPLDTWITNTVTIDSNETLPKTIEHELHVGEIFWAVEDLSITPNVLRRNGTAANIVAIIHLPEGIKKDGGLIHVSLHGRANGKGVEGGGLALQRMVKKANRTQYAVFYQQRFGLWCPAWGTHKWLVAT